MDDDNDDPMVALKRSELVEALELFLSTALAQGAATVVADVAQRRAPSLEGPRTDRSVAAAPEVPQSGAPALDQVAGMEGPVAKAIRELRELGQAPSPEDPRTDRAAPEVSQKTALIAELRELERPRTLGEKIEAVLPAAAEAMGAAVSEHYEKQREAADLLDRLRCEGADI